ncbi:unnamed protein product [Colias eurytheme]|nr:unnamed protein product [Colias eurytheme]
MYRVNAITVKLLANQNEAMATNDREATRCDRPVSGTWPQDVNKSNSLVSELSELAERKGTVKRYLNLERTLCSRAMCPFETTRAQHGGRRHAGWPEPALALITSTLHGEMNILDLWEVSRVTRSKCNYDGNSRIREIGSSSGDRRGSLNPNSAD